MKRLGSRSRALAVAAVLIGLVGALVVAIPSFGSPAPSAVRLHLGSDGRYFAYGSTQQPLTTNSCAINSPEPLIDLSAGTRSPGLVSDGIGVKGAGGNGSPCSQIDSAEALKLARGGSLGARKFMGVRLDLEMTKNAVVQLTLASATTSRTYQLQTGASITSAQSGEAGYDTTVPYFASSSPGDELDACASPNSSGPNSAGNDNCQWTVLPGFDFDTITLSTTTGTVTLEGSGDFGNSPSYETLLYLANSAPTANADGFTTDEDIAKQGNVLANDSDPDGNPLTATLVTPPSNGGVTLALNGAFTYTPAANWSGTDSFVYAASDGISTTNARATIVVSPVNDPPVARSGSASTPEDTAVVVTVATDIDSTNLTASCTSSGGGTITDRGDGSVSFSPPVNFNGSVTVTCSVTDDAGATTASSATIVVGVSAVNDRPIAVDDIADVDAGGSVSIPVLGNDTDVDLDVLSVTGIAAVSPSGATAVVNGDGTVAYTPPSGFTGAGSFTYQATDGNLSSNTATARITVLPVLCSLETVSVSDGDVSGAFTRLTDDFACKRYELEATDAGAGQDTILFAPVGGNLVSYRGVLTFSPESAPTSGGGGAFSLLLRYDPTGGDSFQPVLWCIDPQFDGADAVTSATLPAGQSWCIASADTRPDSVGDLVTTWQVYGVDDPKFTR